MIRIIRGGIGINCPPGTFNKGTGAQDIDKCEPCPAGHYCCRFDQGNWNPYGTSCVGGVINPTACRVGSYQSRTGQHTCDLCPAGKMCTETGLRLPNAPCEVGKYCMIGTGTTASVCPKGTFNDHRNATSFDDCNPCPAGYYCDHVDGNTWVVPGQEPTACEAGFYCMLETPERDTYPCPKGTDGRRILNAHSAMNCTACEEGFYCPERTGDASVVPVRCPEGHFCPRGTGGSNDADPDIPECPSGTYLDEEGKSRVEDCKKCTAGSFCGAGVGAPVGCAAGSFSNEDGITSQSDCEPCPAGYKCPSQGLTEPEVCGAGNFSPARAIDVSTKVPNFTCFNTIAQKSFSLISHFSVMHVKKVTTVTLIQQLMKR